VDVIVPEEAFEAVCAAVVKNSDAPKFKKVVMSLQDILSGDFFTEYIKKGENARFCQPWPFGV
jgi:ribonucleases P/MRP protein subunit RPP40